ncbi:MAG: MlaD family protein [Fimbriimonadaceae bacterium]
MSGAWKVGLLVVVFVGLLVGAYQIVGRSLFARPPSIYFAEFEDAGGIQRGAPVLMAGVRVGTVDAVELRGPRLARLALAIDPNVRIPSGTQAFLATSLIGFGDNPIQLLPPSRDSAAALAPGAVLAGRKGSALESLVPDLEQTIAELNATLAATRSLIEDESLRKRIEELLAATEKTIGQFGLVAGRVDRVIAAHQGSIGEIVASVQGTLSEVRQGARLARELLADERWADQAKQMLETLNRTAAEAEKIMASVNQLVGDPVLQQNLKDTLANVRTVSESGTAVAANAEEITRNGIVVSEQVAELSKKANALADPASEVLGKLQGFFERVPRTSGIGPSRARSTSIGPPSPTGGGPTSA